MIRYRCRNCGKAGTVPSKFHLPSRYGCRQSPDGLHHYDF